MLKIFSFFVLIALLVVAVASHLKEDHFIVPRVLPNSEDCNPGTYSVDICRKGDWIATSIADCEKDGFFTCNAQNSTLFSWTVDVAENDYCRPVSSGKRFTCGAAGTNTRCVCSDYKIYPNECRCQYWPPEDYRTNIQAFCTGYYVGGASGVHHWACCNNCNDSLEFDNDRMCAGRTWQGGSQGNYCSLCGQSNTPGLEKYYFNCLNCRQQRHCESYCDNYDIGGLCWKWLDCFKGCCQAKAQWPPVRLTDPVPICGNKICESGESATTCPLDCCPTVNEMCDTGGRDICLPDCCGSPSCCLESGSGMESGSRAFGSPQALVLLAFLGGLMLQ